MGNGNVKSPFKSHNITVIGWTWKTEKDIPFWNQSRWHVGKKRGPFNGHDIIITGGNI
jgi:hypothetical protein